MRQMRVFGRPIERRRLLGAVATALTILAVGAWALFLRPTSLGGPASYVFVSGESMEPTYYNGDFIVSRKQGSYEPGDIVVFRVPKGEVGEGHHVIHRIIGGSAESGFTTQGDNRSSPDLWRPTNEDVVGEVWFTVPGAASRWLPLLHTPLAVGLFAGMWAFWVAMAPMGEKGRPRSPPPPPRSGAPHSSLTEATASTCATRLGDGSGDPIPALSPVWPGQLVIIAYGWGEVHGR